MPDLRTDADHAPDVVVTWADRWAHLSTLHGVRHAEMADAMQREFELIYVIEFRQIARRQSPPIADESILPLCARLLPDAMPIASLRGRSPVEQAEADVQQALPAQNG